LNALTYDNLRLVESSVLAEYLVNTNVLLERGNHGFATYMRREEWRRNPAVAAAAATFTEPYVLFHSWMPGMVELSPLQASVVADLVLDEGASARAPLHAAMARALELLGWLADVPVDTDQVAQATASVFAAMQNLTELRQFLRCVRALRPQVVVEIGTARGGMLYALTQIAAPDALLVSIDLAGGGNGGGQTERERELFASFGRHGQRLCCLLGDSADPATLDCLEEILGARPIDLLFIDGDHSFDGVKADLVSYGPKVAPGGLVALHDICLFPEEWGPQTGVGPFWRALQEMAGASLTEIVDPHGVSTRERPGGERWSWGIGMLSGRRCVEMVDRLL
jgi:predicted O-methyltransferase YrrM